MPTRVAAGGVRPAILRDRHRGVDASGDGALPPREVASAQVQTGERRRPGGGLAPVEAPPPRARSEAWTRSLARPCRMPRLLFVRRGTFAVPQVDRGWMNVQTTNWEEPIMVTHTFRDEYTVDFRFLPLQRHGRGVPRPCPVRPAGLICSQWRSKRCVARQSQDSGRFRAGRIS